jgi:hypothetical protein
MDKVLAFLAGGAVTLILVIILELLLILNVI